jgi:hypothetical protein
LLEQCKIKNMEMAAGSGSAARSGRLLALVTVVTG